MSTIALDSNVIIYFFDGASEFQEKAHALLSMGYAGTELTVSSLAFLELLAKSSFSDAEAQELFEESKRLPIHIEPVSIGVLLAAARLRRVEKSLKTPDAIHLASALAAGATQFVTNDQTLLKHKVKGLKLVAL